jgi:hypothetical protein
MMEQGESRETLDKTPYILQLVHNHAGQRLQAEECFVC